MSDAVIVRFTPHARCRRKQMRVGEHRIIAVLDDPDMDTPDPTSDEGRRRAHKDDLCVVYRDDGEVRVVITVLWNTHEEYVR